MLHLYKTDRQFVQTEFPGIRTAVIWSENGAGAEFHEFKPGTHFPFHGHDCTCTAAPGFPDTCGAITR
jgi:hypothetical protein